MKKQNEYRERSALIAQPFELELDRSGIYLEVLRLHFERTGNHLFVWKAIQQAHELKLAMPDWVMEYLHESADQLFEIEGGLGKKTPQAIAAALSLKTSGGGSMFKQFQIAQRNIEIYQIVQDLREQSAPRSDSSIFESVGESFNLSRTAISKIVDDYESNLGIQKVDKHGNFITDS